MRRLFWGFVKIALVVVLIIWASRELFPDESVMTTADETLSFSEKGEELLSKEIKNNDSRENPLETKEEKVLLSSREPVTEQQKKYVEYSLKAGSPGDFAGIFVAQGPEPLSIQIARAVGEPQGEWNNFTAHKKTFWILAEMTLQNINVDAAGSFSGGVVKIQEGEISIDASSLMAPSFSPSPVSLVPVSSSRMESLNVDSPIPPQKTTRRMSARTWEKVLQTGSR